jgi:hypothetical protein
VNPLEQTKKESRLEANGTGTIQVIQKVWMEYLHPTGFWQDSTAAQAEMMIYLPLVRKLTLRQINSKGLGVKAEASLLIRGLAFPSHSAVIAAYGIE